jgi:tetratricopeptide (TPR) repeat protein
MKHITAKGLLLMLPGLLATPSGAQQQPPHLTAAKTRAAKPAVKVTPSAQLLFGSLGIASKSVEARQQLEMALDQYENAQYADAILHAQKATEKDPNFALAYAVWSYAARWIGAAPDALQKAQTLSAKTAPDEQLLVKFMTGTQQADAVPAIVAMNDLVKAHPKDKHVLYLAGEWLFFQQDYPRGRQLLEASLAQDPKFPPVLNTLGYAYVESMDPQPAKGIGLLRRYADVLPDDPNPQDSLGEVLRMTGDDEGSLAHYAAALEISSSYVPSQYGRGDTYTLMGKYGQARAEYGKALAMASDTHDRLHIELQKALVYFWEGDLGTGRLELAKLSGKAAEAKDAMALFDIDYARALLAADAKSAREILAATEARLTTVPDDMLPSERNSEYANVLREEVRLAVVNHDLASAETLTHKLEGLAASSRDQKVESIYESAHGYVMCANGDFANAVDELTSDLHSPLVVQQLVATQEKLNNADGTEKAKTRLKYLRTPTAEWFVVTKTNSEAAKSAAN